MDVNRTSTYTNNTTNTNNRTSKAQTRTAEAEKKPSEAKATETDAYVLETGNYENTTGQIDNDKIKSMWNEIDAKTSQLTTLANALFSKQGTKSEISNLGSDLVTNIRNLKDGIKNGTIKVDDETIAQAQKDVAEDGYYGVNQTSDRLFDFAKALSGGDAETMEKMRGAVIKGFEEAERIWGESLPQISKDTFNATMDKFDTWAKDNGATFAEVERM